MTSRQAIKVTVQVEPAHPASEVAPMGVTHDMKSTSNYVNGVASTTKRIVWRDKRRHGFEKSTSFTVDDVINRQAAQGDSNVIDDEGAWSPDGKTFDGLLDAPSIIKQVAAP